mmetsp:Transcript_23425/g.55777  ORF Transcript_23425/g.55777 Transcript_23425/m.55777 type:complete len:277 (-) Transcript_23425:229-1059(-)
MLARQPRQAPQAFSDAAQVLPPGAVLLRRAEHTAVARDKEPEACETLRSLPPRLAASLSHLKEPEEQKRCELAHVQERTVALCFNGIPKHTDRIDVVVKKLVGPREKLVGVAGGSVPDPPLPLDCNLRLRFAAASHQKIDNEDAFPTLPSCKAALDQKPVPKPLLFHDTVETLANVLLRPCKPALLNVTKGSAPLSSRFQIREIRVPHESHQHQHVEWHRRVPVALVSEFKNEILQVLLPVFTIPKVARRNNNALAVRFPIRSHSRIRDHQLGLST